MGNLMAKRYLVAVILAVVAFVAAFYVVFAGFVPLQWGREQSAKVNGIEVGVLPP